MLTEKRIRDARPESKPVILWDGTAKGLGVKIQPGGTKSFVLSYRVGNRKKLASLGRVGEISLKDARRRAGTELASVRDGGVDPLERRRELRDAPTVNDLVDRFFNEYAPARVEAGRLRPKTVGDYSIQARKYIRPVLGKLQVARVTRADVERLSAKLAKTPVQRNRCLALVSRLFSYAENLELRPQGANPCRGVTRTREHARTRVLEPSELSALARALDDLDETYPYAVAAIRCAAMTALRIAECLSLEWSNVSLEGGRAILPETKTGPRTIPLAAPVVELLSALPRVHGNPCVFPASRGASITYKHARHVFGLAREAAGLPDVRLHDLRRTLATRLAASGVNAFTLRDVLGHSTLAMSNRYVRMASDALTAATEQAAAITSAAMAGKDA